jgi:7-cyano-7-deazaguanine reductase
MCLDHLDIDVDCYNLDPGLLKLDDSGAIARETVHSHLFRSVCPITGQPDWASVLIEYFGPRIDHEALLRYLVSFRLHPAFHESTIEQIFMDISRHCRPDQLTVYGRFTRRGGIDINPFRSTDETVAPAIRLPRQ